MQFKDLDSLYKYIEEEAENIIQNQVANKIIEVIQDHVQEDVYNQYKPKRYERTGKLKKDIVKMNITKGVTIYPNRMEDGKYIPDIIETGEGYKYPDKYNYGYGKPRPFVRETIKDLKQNEQHIKVFIQEIEKKGFKVVRK